MRFLLNIFRLIIGNMGKKPDRTNIEPLPIGDEKPNIELDNIDKETKIEYNMEINITGKPIVPVPMLDYGHGNNTPGKRSPVWEDGTQLFEWEFNRAIGKHIEELLKENDMPYIVVVTEVEDIPLYSSNPNADTRAKRVNDFTKANPDMNVFGISIHGNAFTDGRPNGVEVFTSPGQTKSDEIATIFFDKLTKGLGWKKRADYSDGDPDKEAKFAILTKTAPPFILTENGFYSNEEECKKMMNPEYQKLIAKLHFDAIVETKKLF